MYLKIQIESMILYMVLYLSSLLEARLKLIPILALKILSCN